MIMIVIMIIIIIIIIMTIIIIITMIRRQSIIPLSMLLLHELKANELHIDNNN